MAILYCPTTALLYDSIPAALLIRQVDYWLRRPAGGIMHEGEHWIYHSYRDWQRELLPTMSEQAIRDTVRRRLLPKGGLLSWHDRRSRRVHYRLDYVRLAELYEERDLEVPAWVAAGPLPRGTQLSGDVEIEMRDAIIKGATGGVGDPALQGSHPRSAGSHPRSAGSHPRSAGSQPASGGLPAREWRAPSPRVAGSQPASGGLPARDSPSFIGTETITETTTETLSPARGPARGRERSEERERDGQTVCEYRIVSDVPGPHGDGCGCCVDCERRPALLGAVLSETDSDSCLECVVERHGDGALAEWRSLGAAVAHYRDDVPSLARAIRLGGGSRASQF